MKQLIKFNCPNCGESINENLACKNNHHFQNDEDVLILLEQKFKEQLYNWLEDFHDFRSNKIDPLDFENLPQSGLKTDRNIWKARINDLKLIKKELKKASLKILEIGSWNGWLANSLSKLGHQVVAVDFFIHENDGLKSRKHYSNPNWTSIQMNIDQLSDFNEQFDIIIFNRCFAYLNNFKDSIEDAKKLLKPKGKIIITGINYSKAEVEAKELTITKQLFKEKYDKHLLFKKTKGYISTEDLEYIQSKGFTLKNYPGIKNQIKSYINTKNNVAYYATFSNNTNFLLKI